MATPKEAIGSVKAGEKGKNWRDTEAAAKTGAFQAGKSEPKMDLCNPSVCVGSQKPTNCICPTVKK